MTSSTLSYSVRYSKVALKFLKKTDPPTAKLITAWIRKNLENCSDPRAHGKALTSDFKGAWRYRLGDYRILTEISDQTITILIIAIGHSREIYKKSLTA